ncbi:MAG: adenosylmethionine decarboxylase [Myxococcota bacterium]|nr:adenosylmethionine decarboxylase [Myxococcota bacterium]
MKTIGRHLIAEFYGCDVDVINSLEDIKTHMCDAAVKIGATVLGEKFHQFTPQGVSGTVVIAESHLSIHTWPEVGYVAVDIFTCGGLDPNIGFKHLGLQFKAESARVQEIVRGLPEDIAEYGQVGPDDVSVITKMTTEIDLGTDEAA